MRHLEEFLVTEKALPPLDKHSTLHRILHDGMFSAGLLLACAAFAFWAANSHLLVFDVPMHEWLHRVWETKLGIALGGLAVDKPLHHWVNDGLMAIFFFVVGLEIKREVMIGELASVRKALLPAIAAIGGMAVPAACYALVNMNGDGMNGWGIPMATDIAFAAGVIGLLGARVHPNLAIFLVALAIVDDLGAVLVIALFYTETIQLGALAVGLGLIVISALIGMLGVRSVVPFLVLAIIAWFAFLNSGIHASIEGVLFALTIPTNARYESARFMDRIRTLISRFDEVDDAPDTRLVNARQQRIVRAIESECIHVEAPLQRIENKLHPWSALVIMPVFALANAGVAVDFSEGPAMLLKPVTIGVIFGLLVGKPLGIFLASWIAVRSGAAELPEGVTWSKLVGLGFLGGIGFTMSLFVSQLAFGGANHDALLGAAHLTEAKAGVLFASVCAAVAGSGILLAVSRKPAAA
jgi:NhaA family Na+:H+ antiporter